MTQCRNSTTSSLIFLINLVRSLSKSSVEALQLRAEDLRGRCLDSRKGDNGGGGDLIDGGEGDI